ncbi:MAG: hypothetical protein QOD50_520, partial [Actinomycetota bacterium]|nr:hypothetical protein [Actinomycetota bacterium]
MGVTERQRTNATTTRLRNSTAAAPRVGTAPTPTAL